MHFEVALKINYSTCCCILPEHLHQRSTAKSLLMQKYNYAELAILFFNNVEIIAIICLYTPENKKHKAVSYPCVGGESDKVVGEKIYFFKPL